MHGALKARPVKGCTAAVCEVDQSDQEIKVNRISNFSTFHNFSYEETGLRMWRAFNVGTGKLVLWSELDIQVPGAITLKPSLSRTTVLGCPASICETAREDEPECQSRCCRNYAVRMQRSWLLT